MARLFYPILFCVTAASASALWTRQWLPSQWLSGLGVRQAQAQSADAEPRAAPSFEQASPRRPRQDARYAAEPVGSRSADAGPPGAGGAPREAFQRGAAAPPGAQLRIPAPAVQTPGAAAAPAGGPAAGEGRIPFENAQVVARVGADEHILLGDVIAEVNKEFAQQSRKYHPRDHEALKQMLVYKQVKQLIPIKVLVAEAKKKIPKDKFPEVMQQVDAIFDQRVLPLMLKESKLDSAEAYDAQLKAEGSSLKRLKETFAETQIVQQFVADHTKVDESVSPDDLYAYYRAHYDDYKFEAKVRWEQLLVKFTRRSKQEALKNLAEMGNQVIHGAAWDAVAKARSEGLTAAEGGAYEWTTKGSLRFKALDEALFSLPIGAMSIILEDERSAQIVRVIERKDAGVVSFEEAQKEIKKQIVDERIKAKKNEFIKTVLEDQRPAIWTVFDEKAAAEQQRGAAAQRRPPGQQQR